MLSLLLLVVRRRRLEMLELAMLLATLTKGVHDDPLL